jgi:transcriptional regulator with XRE-family HTH domain
MCAIPDTRKSELPALPDFSPSMAVPAPSDRAAALGTRLHAARRAAGLTQAQAAERTGLGRSRIAEWEAGVHMPGADTLQRLAAAYGVTVDSLHGQPDAVPGMSGGVHLPSYWKGRMEGAQLAAAAVRGLAGTIDRLAVSLESDVHGIIASGLLNGEPAPATLVAPPTPEEMARARELLDAQMARDRAAEAQTHEPPARRGRRAGGKG